MKGYAVSLAECLACIHSFVMTSKSVAVNEREGKVSLYVSKRATKDMVRRAMEAMFGLNVLSVRSLNTKGGQVRTKRGVFKKGDRKKMIVSTASTFKVSDMLGGE